MKKYTFELVIHEGCDEFWESLIEEKKTGCDEITEEVKGLIQSGGAFFVGDNCELRLVRFDDKIDKNWPIAQG